MRKVIVTRVTLLLAALFIAAAGLFGWVRSRPGIPERVTTAAPDPTAHGAALFERHCGSCHAEADLRPALRGLTAARRRELQQFLTTHGEAPDEDDLRILDHLTRESSRSTR